MLLRKLPFLVLFIQLLFGPAHCLAQIVQEEFEDTLQKFYGNGRLKVMVVRKEGDVYEYRSYFKSGQIKDSLHLKIGADRHEVPVGVNKTYHSNGRLASITRYGKSPNEYVMREYSKTGVLLFYEQRPTGITRYYNKRGKQMREYDLNKMVYVKVPKRYHYGLHLRASGYSRRILAKKARLVSNTGKSRRIKAGALISITVGKDTNLVRHCLVEGFSKDSIYVSKFNYNEKYDGAKDKDLLKFHKTYALHMGQVKNIYYTRHNNARRRRGALLSFSVGFTGLIYAMLNVPGSVKSINDGEADYPTMAINFGTSAGVAIIFMSLSKHLYKTTVPRRYDMKQWKLVPRL